jgi:Spy/CpxP family protein refolding chaperone
MLEKRLKERTGAVVKERLALTDAQMTRLESTNRQFESQRSQLITRERDVRRELRKQIQSGDAANQARVGQLLDQAMQLERQRLELQQNEQRELAKFLTPVQRAKLFGLQNELRRRAQDMRDRPLREQRKLQSRKARNFN